MAFLTTLDVYRAVLERIQFPGAPHVASVRFEVAPDATGEDSIYVYVILDDGMPPELRRYSHLASIEMAYTRTILDALRGTQFQFAKPPNVYVNFRLRSEDEKLNKQWSG